MCSAGIFATIPVARNLQKFVYNTAGRELFTYTVLSVVVAGAVILLYFFIFRLRVKKVSQYIWLFTCAGLYIYFTLQLKRHPEEAVHFLMYGLLAYFLFRALSRRIQDRTVYITSALYVLLVGILDEFLQWIMPSRFWDFRDIGLNIFSGSILLLCIWKGISPDIISKPLRKRSVNILTRIFTLNLIVLGLCLSNTPNIVGRYTGAVEALSWLRYEEPMTEYGYIHEDPEIGVLYSRFTLDKLRETDQNNGKSFGKILTESMNADFDYQGFVKLYNQNVNPFLYEFGIHLWRRDSKFESLNKTGSHYKKVELSNIAFRENMILEKYFGNTLKHSGLNWTDESVDKLKKTASQWNDDYISNAGYKLIVSFNLYTVWTVIAIMSIILWVSCRVWKRRLAP